VFFLASLSSLVDCFRVSPGANPRLEHLKGALLTTTLLANIRLGWKDLRVTNTLAYGGPIHKLGWKQRFVNMTTCWVI